MPYPFPTLLNRIVSRRAALEGGLGAALLVSGACATAQPPARVSVRDHGAQGNGRRDDTGAFQRACDLLRNGGVAEVPAGTYLVSTVRIRNRGVRLQLAPGAILRKSGGGGLAARGMFEIDGMLRAGFELAGGMIDLNGEGPQGIGTPGRIPNAYANHMVTTLKGIGGPLNAAVFARRASDIVVRDCAIANSGENGLLFRNCGAVTVRGCRFSNIANYGVEFSFLIPGGDGGSGPLPPRDGCMVTGCHFENIDDLAFGSGNGVGIGGGGARNLGRFRNYAITDCTFSGCHRDIHFEFDRGSWIEGMEIARITSADARQGSIGLVNVRNAVIRDVAITNPGAAPTTLLVRERPEIYGILLSSGFANVALRNVTIRDTRPGRVASGRVARFEKGSRKLRFAADTVTASDQSSWIGIVGGNPQGTAYVGRVQKVLGPREVELDVPAGATANGGTFALGGLTRNGVILTNGKDVQFEDVIVEAGAAGDAASVADAAAVRMWLVEGNVKFVRTRLKAPMARGAQKHSGIRVTTSSARLTGLNEVSVEGYAQRVVSQR